MIRLALRVRREQAELALAELLDLAPAGVEEVDLGADGIEYAVYGSAAELPSLPALRVAAGDALVDVFTTEIADDWSSRWREFHRPVLIPPPADAPARVPALHVRPPWERAYVREQAAPPVTEIVIDPAQAFGTGAHATTRMSLELMLQLAAGGLAHGPLVDLGCGSGVLSIAAAKLGWDPVLALDHDPESVAATRENARINGASLEVCAFDLREQAVPGAAGAPPVVVANLLRPLLLALAGSISFAPAHLVASGLLAEEVDEVAGAFAGALGLTVRARRDLSGWAAVWLAAPCA